jgi:hypothetical protein
MLTFSDLLFLVIAYLLRILKKELRYVCEFNVKIYINFIKYY